MGAANRLCPICGEPIFSFHRVAGRWRYCPHHKLFVTQAKFDGRCGFCGGVIAKGAQTVLCKEHGKWTAFHPAGCCEGDAWRVLHVQPGAPWEVIEAAYRALSLLHHPDRGGDLEAMKDVNNAMDELRAMRERKAA